tara:strand:- start:12190 stop:12426 length:237 start_codon:yes stop_codon:yes gene_type:complete
MSNLDYRMFLQKNTDAIINNNFQLYYGNCKSVEDLSLKKYNKKTLVERNDALRNEFLKKYENYSEKFNQVLDIFPNLN